MSHTISGIARGAFAATAFLTRAPVPERLYAGAAPWRWAMAWFPVVGALIGTVAAAVWHWRGTLHALPAAVLVVTSSILLTGALHEDGLADSADALGATHARERIFEILKDSRIGAYGALALIGSVTLRVAAVATMQHGVEIALILSHAFGRASAAGIASALPYVTPAATSRSAVVLNGGWFKGAAAWAGMLAILAVVTALSALTPPHAVALLVIVLGLTVLCGAYFVSRVGGTTGDLLGAAEQVCECGVLVACAMLFGETTAA